MLPGESAPAISAQRPSNPVSSLPVRLGFGAGPPLPGLGAGFEAARVISIRRIKSCVEKEPLRKSLAPVSINCAVSSKLSVPPRMITGAAAGPCSEHRTSCVPGMSDSLEVKVLCTARWRRSASEAQGRRREAGSGGSVDQSRDLTNRNRTGGILGRTSGQLIAKSRSIKGQGCRSGRCAVKAVRLTPGDLRSVPLLGTEGAARQPDRDAEVSRGHSRPCSRQS